MVAEIETCIQPIVQDLDAGVPLAIDIELTLVDEHDHRDLFRFEARDNAGLDALIHRQIVAGAHRGSVIDRNRDFTGLRRRSLGDQAGERNRRRYGAGKRLPP